MAATLIVGMFVLTGCGDDNDRPSSSAQETAPAKTSATKFPLTISNCNEDVTFEKRPERVLTSDLVAVQYMVAAGAADKITQRAGAGVEPLRGAAKVVKDVPILDDDWPSRDRIVGSGVDMLYTGGLIEAERADLAKAGVPTLVPSPGCGFGIGTPIKGLNVIESVYSDLELLGKILGTEDAAGAMIDKIRSRMAAVKESFDARQFKTAVVILDPDKALDGFARGSLPHQLLEILGLENVLTEKDPLLVSLSLKRLVDLDPDVVIVGRRIAGPKPRSHRETVAAVKRLPGARDMKAVKANSIVTLVTYDLDFGPRMADALESIAKQITALK